MELKGTIYSNVFYVYEEGRLVGICKDPGESYQKDYFVGDKVKVTDDGVGYICPGISKPGIGVISDIHEDRTDHFFTVVMENGETGICKSARLQVLKRD